MIAVIADDMTGAAEIAGVCLRYGLRVSFELETADVKDADADVVVVATDTRAMAAGDAVKESRRIAGGLKQAGILWIFKKTDSVLRGHVVAELNMLLAVLKKTKALLVPANPAAGRIISGGHYYIDGIPLSETDFGRDPDFPAKSSAVTGLPGFSRVHWGISAELRKGITIPDAVVTQDLDRCAGWLTGDTLPAGSAAFFESCLRHMGKFPAEVPPPVTRDFLSGKTLMVCGSTHQDSRAFIRRAKESPVALVAEMPQELLQKDPDPAYMLAWEREIIHLSAHAGLMVLAVGPQTVHFEGSARSIKQTLARVVRQVISRSPVHHLLIEGGATVFSIVRELGTPALTPVCEIEKGVVKMKVREREPFFLVIKPGSYPWPESLMDITRKRF